MIVFKILKFSLQILSQAPPADTHNGLLTGFRIAYRQSGIQGSAFSIVHVANGVATKGTVNGLLRWTEYAIKVQAYNSAGSGPFSATVLVMTGEGGTYLYGSFGVINFYFI